METIEGFDSGQWENISRKILVRFGQETNPRGRRQLTLLHGRRCRRRHGHDGRHLRGDDPSSHSALAIAALSHRTALHRGFCVFIKFKYCNEPLHTSSNPASSLFSFHEWFDRHCGGFCSNSPPVRSFADS